MGGTGKSQCNNGAHIMWKFHPNCRYHHAQLAHCFGNEHVRTALRKRSGKRGHATRAHDIATSITNGKHETQALLRFY